MFGVPPQRPGAVDEKGAEIAGAAFTHPPHDCFATRRGLARDSTQPGPDLPPLRKDHRIGYRRHEGGGGHWPNPLDRCAPLTGGGGLAPPGTPPFTARPVLIPRHPLLLELGEPLPPQGRQGRGVSQTGERLAEPITPEGEHPPLVPQQTPALISQGRACFAAPLPDPVEHRQILLLHAFHCHQAHTGSVHRRTNRLSVLVVIFSPLPLGFPILGAEQLDGMPRRVQDPRPVRGARSGFDAKQAGRAVGAMKAASCARRRRVRNAPWPSAETPWR